MSHRPTWRRSGAAITAALLGIAIILTGCSGVDSDHDSGKTRSVKADNGTIEVPVHPERVAVLVNAVLPYLNLGGKPVAVSEVQKSALADLPADQLRVYKSATTVGSGSEIDIEKLAALKPDVIVIALNDAGYEKVKDKLMAIAPTVQLGFESDWKFRTDALAEATDTVDANNKQRAQFETLAARIKNDYGPSLHSGKIVEAYRYNTQNPGTFGINNSLCAEVVRDEGIVDFAPAVASAPFEKVSSLAKYELILYSAGVDGTPSEASRPLLESNVWQALPAVQSGHAQPIYCPWGRSFGYMAQYLEGLEKAVATLPKAQ